MQVSVSRRCRHRTPKPPRRAQVAPEDPITAGCERAVVSAGVGVFNVAAVKASPSLSARRSPARRTRSSTHHRRVVAVITSSRMKGLRPPVHPVTGACAAIGRQASSITVAIIAGFITRLTSDRSSALRRHRSAGRAGVEQASKLSRLLPSHSSCPSGAVAAPCRSAAVGAAPVSTSLPSSQASPIRLDHAVTVADDLATGVAAIPVLVVAIIARIVDAQVRARTPSLQVATTHVVTAVAVVPLPSSPFGAEDALGEVGA